MTNQTRRSWIGRLMLPAVLAAGLGSMMAGCCCSTPESIATVPSSFRLPPLQPGSKAQAEAFKKEVDADQFPTGPAAKQ